MASIGIGLQPPSNFNAPEDHQMIDPGKRGEEGHPFASIPSNVIGGSVSVPVMTADDPSTIGENETALHTVGELPLDAVGAVPVRAAEPGGPAEDGEDEAAEDAESVGGLVPFVVASVTCLALGNYAYSAGMTGRRKARDLPIPTAAFFNRRRRTR